MEREAIKGKRIVSQGIYLGKWSISTEMEGRVGKKPGPSLRGENIS